MPEARKRPCAICRRWFRPNLASGTPPTCLREAGMPDHAPAEDASQLAPPEPRLRHRLPDRPTRGADPIPAGTVAAARAVEPTTLGGELNRFAVNVFARASQEPGQRSEERPTMRTG